MRNTADRCSYGRVLDGGAVGVWLVVDLGLNNCHTRVLALRQVIHALCSDLYNGQFGEWGCVVEGEDGMW